MMINWFSPDCGLQLCHENKNTSDNAAHYLFGDTVCGASNPVGYNFCGTCGKALRNARNG